MNDGQGAKQQIVERVKQSSNILVTVSKNPSVDELSAALGLTIMLNKLKKHATSVVSGEIPPAINFLDPEKTFENTVDSLRDFIIALDKEKADHLRYKVDGDVVKIFITPYRTTINQDDLDFSQGDYNVEVVLALGVENKDDLDTALSAHGKILHDATVATLSCGDAASNLGSIDWHEPGASSISEMLVSLSEALKTDKPVLDEQIATAFLTGIVAATDRFSNNKTSSKVMTMAAQLMAAGANQQLIAAKLSEANEISAEPNGNSSDNENSDGTTNLSEDTPSKLDKTANQKNKSKTGDKKEEPKKDEPADDGSLAISHEREGDLDAVAKEVASDNQADAAKKAEEVLASQLESVAPAAASDTKPSVADLQKDLAAAGSEIDEASELPPVSPAKKPAQTLAEMQMPSYEPTMGGTLNATTEQASDDKHREEEKDRNRTILSHGSPIPPGSTPTFGPSPMNASGQPQPDEPGLPLEPASPAPPPLPPLPSTPSQPQTLADLDKQNRSSAADVLSDVHAAFESQPTPSSASFGPLPSQSQTPEPSSPVSSNDLPPLPDFTTLPPPPLPPAAGPLPSTPTENPEQLGQIFDTTPTSTPNVPQEPADPNQFKIPGQS
jgi:hypothetical protein